MFNPLSLQDGSGFFELLPDQVVTHHKVHVLACTLVAHLSMRRV